MRKIKRLAVTAALTTALLAVTASAAMAGPAYWSSTANGFKLSGTLTVSKAGGSAKTCTGTSGYGSAMANGGFIAINAGPSYYRLYCVGGGWIDINATGYADHTSGAFSLRFNNWPSGALNPWGGVWYQAIHQVPFTNATGGNPSKITYTNTTLGTTDTLQTVTATGTLNVTTLTGGTLTLTP